LQGAASIAGLLITTEAMIAEPRDETIPEGHPHPPHGADIDF
jgi:chaperonin GroEL (HSP60 family)